MNNNELFEKFKSDIIKLDPVQWAESHLTLDGQPFRINGNGYKPFSDIYRYIGIKCLEKTSKPVILVKGRQTGGTTLISALTAFFACNYGGNNGHPPLHQIHFFPTLVHAFGYAKSKLNPLIANSVTVDVGNKKMSYLESRLDKSTPANDSLQYKQFVGGSVLRIESTGLDASRIRGTTASLCAYDEAQLISAQAISNANKVLTTSKYGPVGKGIQIYLGTPLQKGSNYWKMWNASSQQYYHLGCESCGEYFPLYSPNSNSWENVWLYGKIVKCSTCGTIQDKLAAQERGKWIALNKDENCYYTGYHINQLYMPFFTKEDIIKEKPENHPVNSERVYMNECIGEFYSGDSSPITPEEIHEKCADQTRKMRASISISENIGSYVGFDWGKKKDAEGSQGQSYSCAVVLSDKGSGLLNVEFTTMLKRNDFEEKKAIVEQLFRQYSIKCGVGDIGYANDLTEVLQRTHGDRFLASEAAGHLNNHIKYVDDYFPKRIVFEKDYYIDEVYGLLKKGMIRFPYGDYEKIATLIQHICSMEIKTTMNRIGEAQSKYVKGSTPNDLFMALINAYIAYKFDITKGFKNINNGSAINQLGGGKIPAVLAYAKFR